MAETLSPDYLVVGAGAMGMAFVDTLVTDSKATVIMVDRYASPGGHWTTAYPYVRLHQPSKFYGVNSRHLGEDKIDEVGLNKGLHELATGDEVRAYYNAVMYQTFLPSGRVTYYPKHEYTGEGEFQSIITNKSFRVSENTRIVDATFSKVTVPSMTTPSFQVSADVNLVTPNNLPNLSRPYGGYTVIGSGKTGIDASLWLLSNGIDPKDISWIMPRDAWLFDRKYLQPGSAFAESTVGNIQAMQNAVKAATSVEDAFQRFEAAGTLIRIDQTIEPTMFRCGTISASELMELRKVANIIRLGRVVSLGHSEVTLEKGTYKPTPDTLYIDCSANGLLKQKPVPVFVDNTITLQPVRFCQQVFSAAFIAHVEVTYDNDTIKNDMCRVVPHPYEPIDYLIINLLTNRNGLRWAAEPKTAAWLAQARLDWYGTLIPPAPKDPAEVEKFYRDVAAKIQGHCQKIEQLLGQLSGEEGAGAQAQTTKL